MGDIILCTIIHTVCFMYLLNIRVGCVNIRDYIVVNIFNISKGSYCRAYLVCNRIGSVI